jgi:hypothetical protein
MAENHTAQNRYTGGFVKRRPVKGGLQRVTERHVIALDGCWCGEPLDHDWPGKSTGAVHPRETGGTVVTTEAVRLAVKDIKAFDKEIKDLLLEIVNEHGVRYRMIDSQHIALYPPDGTSRPFKVSASRQTVQNRQILEVQFMERFGLRSKKAEAKAAAKAEEEAVPEVVPDPPSSTVEPEPEVQVIEYVETDVSDIIRGVIATLSTALGIDSLEDEALRALDENDSLIKKVSALTAERDRYKSMAEAENREAQKERESRQRFEGLLDEAVARAEKAESKIATLKELFS